MVSEADVLRRSQLFEDHTGHFLPTLMLQDERRKL
jgi:hypothetical protein